MRSFEKIKEDTIQCFKESFPGEQVTKTVFSEWCLDLYCELIQRYESYRQSSKELNDYFKGRY